MAVRIEQFGPADELQVRTVNGQLFSALDLFAGVLGEAGDDGVAQGQGHAGLCLFVGGADDEVAAAGGDARGSLDPDHVFADDLEIGDGDAVGEDDLANVGESGSVDGHGLSGDHLRRGEYLDAQSDVCGQVLLHAETARERSHQDDGQEYA